MKTGWDMVLTGGKYHHLEQHSPRGFEVLCGGWTSSAQLIDQPPEAKKCHRCVKRLAALASQSGGKAGRAP